MRAMLSGYSLVRDYGRFLFSNWLLRGSILFSPIIDQMQLGDQGSLQIERSKQNLHTLGCMLYSEGGEGKKLVRIALKANL